MYTSKFQESHNHCKDFIQFYFFGAAFSYHLLVKYVNYFSNTANPKPGDDIFYCVNTLSVSIMMCFTRINLIKFN